MAYLYKKVENAILEQIAQGHLMSGSRIPSEMELTESLGVSRQTVRNAISSLTRQGVLYAVQGKGTFVSDNTIALPREYLIGFSTTSFKVYNLYPQILQGVTKFTDKAGYSLILGQTKNTIETERECLLNFLDKKVDAAIVDPVLCGLPNANEDVYRMFDERSKPLIAYSARHPNEIASYVVADDVQGGYLAAKHLLDLGHRSIGAIFQADDTRGFDRYKGLSRASLQYGVPIRSNYIDWYSGMRIDRLEESYNGTPDPDLVRILRSCTALILYNDIITQHVLHVLDDLHLRCPEDISIVSFDDTELNAGTIGLTTIPYPGLQIGECLGETVIELLNDPTKKIRRTLPVELVVRESTRAI